MIKAELIKQSPLRIFDDSTHGGVGKGNIGILAARQGVGKTAALVHLATDKLFQGQHVLHMTFAAKTDHIISYYEDIFQEIAKRRDLEGAMEVHDEVVKHRSIVNFDQKTVSMDLILKSLSSRIDAGQFKVDTLVIDEYDFSQAETEDLDRLKAFAGTHNLEIWFSVCLQESGADLERKVPKLIESFMDKVDVLVDLRTVGEKVKFQLVKDHGLDHQEDMHLLLDPLTLLITKEA